MSDAKPAGWFSRKHRGRDEHEAARNSYLNSRGAAHRQGVARANEDDRAKRNNKQQLKELDRRLGKGKGAQRERARLAA